MKMSYINKRKKSVKSLSDLPEKLLVWQENDRSNDSNSFVLASDLAKRNNCFRLEKVTYNSSQVTHKVYYGNNKNHPRIQQCWQR